MTEEKLYIIDGECWKCKGSMKVAVIRADLEKRGSTTVGPEKFSGAEITFATSKGVLIKEHYSASVEKSYLANTCVQCGTFIGSFYLFTDYLDAAEMGDYPFETFDLPIK